MPHTRSRSCSSNFQVLFPDEFHTLVSHVALQLTKTDKIEGHHISWNPSKAFLVPHIVILLFGFSFCTSHPFNANEAIFPRKKANDKMKYNQRDK
jgi:hypothetical protein